MGHLGFMDFEPTTIIATLLNTLLIVLAFKHFLFDKVNAMLDARNNAVTKTYADADAALENAQKMEAEYTEKISAAKEESAEIVKKATKRAQKRADEIEAEAKESALKIIEKADADVEHEKKRAVNQIKNEISDIAMSIAEKVVTKELDASAHEKLIEDFIKDIGDAS